MVLDDIIMNCKIIKNCKICKKRIHITGNESYYLYYCENCGSTRLFNVDFWTVPVLAQKKFSVNEYGKRVKMTHSKEEL